VAFLLYYLRPKSAKYYHVCTETFRIRTYFYFLAAALVAKIVEKVTTKEMMVAYM